jgi:uncharacterized protein (TIGR02145 family)
MKFILGLVIFFMVSTSFAGTCGDVNGDDKLNLLDVSHIINFLYRHGPAPDCGASYEGICGDVSGDSKLNLLDVSHTISYLYRGGTGPFCGTVTDIDGNVYRTIKIGDQIWMAENLKVKRYSDGGGLWHITDYYDWPIMTFGSYCEYNNDTSYVATYGRLYNWYAATNSRNIAPIGWHVPTDAEWKQLEIYLGMSEAAADSQGWRGTDEGGKLKEIGTTHWIHNDSASNISGFTALPGGFRGTDGNGSLGDIAFDAYLGSEAWFWTSTEIEGASSSFAHLRTLWSFASNESKIMRIGDYKLCGFSIRCIKDRGPTVSTAVVSEITQTTAQCGGIIISEGEAAVTARGVCWSTNPSPTIADNKTIDGAGIGSFTSMITGLTDGTAYYVRAYATNSAGTGYGNTKTFIAGTVTDIDGNVYKTITIGMQLWMAENLKVTHYRNGETIPNVTDNATWAGLGSGAYGEYNYDANNVAIYGRLYNWYAVVDSRNIAPAGWHVPTDAEWKQLEMFLGMSQVQADATDWRGTTEGGKMKETGTTHWLSPNTGATNESGFSGLPGGLRDYDGAYYTIGHYAHFWSSTEDFIFNSWFRCLDYSHSEVNRNSDSKRYGFSVRCVKD